MIQPPTARSLIRPESTPSWYHRRFWGLSFSVTAFPIEHWHTAARQCPRPSDRWHLDEMVVRIAGKHMYLWRAVDHEGEVLEILVQRRRDKRAAVKLMRKAAPQAGLRAARGDD